MTITLHRNMCFFSARCCICDQCFDLGEIDARIESFHSDGVWGDVCMECVKSGIEGIRQRAQEAADRIAACAAEAKEFAQELMASDNISVPTIKAVEEMRKAFYIEHYGVAPSEMQEHEQPF